MTGPCAKQTVVATIVCSDGRRFRGTNHTLNPQALCPRASMPTGQGYEMCRDICQQPAHAEINAIQTAGDAARDGVLYLEGHTYACGPCQDAAREAGVSIVIGSPPIPHATDANHE